MPPFQPKAWVPVPAPTQPSATGPLLAAAIACEQGLLPERDPGLTLACYDDAIAWADGLELV